jgi:hypothetical protein
MQQLHLLRGIVDSLSSENGIESRWATSGSFARLGKCGEQWERGVKKLSRKGRSTRIESTRCCERYGMVLDFSSREYVREEMNLKG